MGRGRPQSWKIIDRKRLKRLCRVQLKCSPAPPDKRVGCPLAEEEPDSEGAFADRRSCRCVSGPNPGQRGEAGELEGSGNLRWKLREPRRIPPRPCTSHARL